MSKMIKTVPFLVLCALIIAVSSVWANWVQDGAAICTATQNQGDQQGYPTIISDGAGGAIITWEDHRSMSRGDIYAQRVNASGDLRWTVDGVALCTATGGQRFPQITSDGAGGAIITWEDHRSMSGGDIYAQRVNASGAIQWTTDGVAICTATEDQYYAAITSDGAGGAIITWMDYRSERSSDIYAQRVNASGAVQWTTDGVALCTAPGEQYLPTIASDGGNGAIVTWRDCRSGSSYNIYAQRVNTSGAVQWTSDGVAICTAGGDQAYPTIVSDGAGGAIVTWHDYRGGNWDIYAQRLTASGAVQWTTEGVAVCAATGGQYFPMITSDSAGGAIITWRDYRSGGDWGIYAPYAQKVSSSGAIQWTTDGVALCTATGLDNPQIVADGAGGAIVTWMDYRNGSNSDIYAQRVNTSGAVQWTSVGVALCTASGTHQHATITSNGAGGAIVTWDDYRIGGDGDIYAQRVDANGIVPSDEPRWPKTPQGLTGRPIYYNNSVVALLISWNRNVESNIYHYEVYRDSIDDFVPAPGNLLASPSDTFLYDVQWRWFPHRFYKLATVDSNGLRSGFALLPPGDLTGTEGPEAPKATYLSQNYPNPFNPVTRIEFGLRESARVSLRIYDAAGRLLRVVSEAQLSPGRYARMWDGKDASGSLVASGVYFYRLNAGSFTETKKMVLLR